MYNPTIEIKSFKPALQLSEETIAFTGTLWIDGKRVANLSNQGFGGCNNIDPVFKGDAAVPSAKAAIATLESEIKKLPRTPCQWDAGKNYAEDGTRLTDCCAAYSTFHDETLVCKKCHNEVGTGQGDGSSHKGMSVSLDWFISELVGETLARRQAASQVRGKVWVRFASDKYGEDQWTAFKCKDTPENRAKLVERHGPISECLNDQVKQKQQITFRGLAAQMGCVFEDGDAQGKEAA